MFVAGYTDVNIPSPGRRRGSRPTTPQCAISCTSTTAAPAVTRPSARSGGPRGSSPTAGSRPRSVVCRRRHGWAPGPLRRERPRSEPALRERHVRTSGGGCPLGFRFVERGRAEHVDDPNAGMGIAAGDYSGDGLDDLFVTNSRGQLHAAYRSRAVGPFADAWADFSRALGQRSTGWGATWPPRPRWTSGARARERRDPRDEPRRERRSPPGRQHGERRRAAAPGGCRRPAQRPRPRGRRLRQRRRPRPRRRLDRRAAPAPAKRWCEGPLARGGAPAVLPGRSRDRGARRRQPTGARGACRLEPPLSEDPRLHFGLGTRRSCPRSSCATRVGESRRFAM